MENSEIRPSIQKRFRRRFLLATHTVFSVSGMILLFFIGWSQRQFIDQIQTHSATQVIIRNPIFVGLNPVPWLVAVGLFVVLVIHAIIFRNREAVDRGETDETAVGKRHRRTLFTLHGTLAAAGMLIPLILASDSHFWQIATDPVTGGQVATLTSSLPLAAFLIPFVFLLLVIPHGIRLLYAELLERSLEAEADQADSIKQKHHEPDELSTVNWEIGSDGELFYPDEIESSALRH